MEEQKTWLVELPGCDRLEVRGEGTDRRFSYVGCSKLHELLQELRRKNGPDPAKWPLPQGHGHHELLVKELVLKLTNRWDHPYPHDEVCHCRNVSLEKVEEAILMGAHTPQAVSRWTSASTSCGTCRPDVESILEFRLKDPSSFSRP